MNILVVDDEPTLRRTIRAALESSGNQVHEATNRLQAMRQVEANSFDLVLLDLRLGQECGLDVLEAMIAVSPGLGVVVITAYSSVDTAVEAMRRGALDYLPKPFTPVQLAELLTRWGQRSPDRRAAAASSSSTSGVENQRGEYTDPTMGLATTSPRMQKVLDTVLAVAQSDATILLRGESGTGKGLIARAVHQRSRRSSAPFVTIHCPSLSAELLESELFGHVKGSFTGAMRSTEGKVSAAEAGTLFLDEVGDLPLPLQPKLLRLAQDLSYERVGETKTRTADVRIIAATNRNLESETAAGRFREDLLYRLNVIEVTVPPLRDRTEDLEPLSQQLLKQFTDRLSKRVQGFTPAALEAVVRHRWPGNVRELRNAIERAVLLTQSDRIDIGDLPPSVAAAPTLAVRLAIGEDVPIDALEVEHIRRVLAASESLEVAARTLGIDASTLYRKRKRYGL